MNPTQETYTALERAYQYFNQCLFGGRLPSCLIVFQRQPKMMGYVSHQRWITDKQDLTDELAINPEYFLGHPLLEVMQTLVHEQCHIWQHHFGKPSRRSYHNREWANKMEEVGLMPSTTGKPGGRRTGQHMNDYVIYGGRFQEAFFELKQQGFTLPWLDRRSAPPEEAAIYDRQGRPALDSLPAREAAILRERLGGGMSSALANIGDAVATGLSPQNEQLYMLAAKKPTRVKYRCAECGNQAWGKSGMPLVCGSCNITFTEID